MSDETLYERDFVTWTERQAEEIRRAAREGSNLPLDWDNLAEEVESVGRSQRSQVRSLVNLIMTHLLNLAYSPAKSAWYGWEAEVGLYRSQLQSALKDSPSLRSGMADVTAEEAPRASRKAILELIRHQEADAAAALKKSTTHFTFDQIIDDEWFLPGTFEKLRASDTPSE